MQDNNSNIDNLTSLRGITALLVAIYHFEGLMGRFIPDASTEFFGKCYLMVDLFFIMSGFIITYVYQANFRNSISALDFKRFVIARFARIYPMHFFALSIILISFIASGDVPNPIQDLRALPTNLLLIHSFGIHDTFTWNVPSWSISAEWFCYLCFPFLAYFLGKNAWIAVPFFVGLSWTIYYSIMYWLPRVNVPGEAERTLLNDLNVSFDYGFLRGLGGFLVGIVLLKLYETELSKKIFFSDLVFYFFAGTAVLFMHFSVPDILVIPIFSGIVMCTVCNTGLVSRFFEFRALQYIGEISYSIYMLHVIIIFSMIEGLSAAGIALSTSPSKTIPFWIGLLSCSAFLGCVIFLSGFSYRLIEKTSRNLIRRKFS